MRLFIEKLFSTSFLSIRAISSCPCEPWKQTIKRMFMVNEIATEFKGQNEKHYMNWIGNICASLDKGCRVVCVHLYHTDETCIFCALIIDSIRGRIWETHSILCYTFVDGTAELCLRGLFCFKNVHA